MKGRRMPGMPGGGNMNNMMKQVQKMQKQMEEMQAELEMLEDMIVAAINEAFRKADEMMENEMKKVTGGVNIPGLF